MWNGVRLPVSPRSLSRAGGIRHAARVQLPNYSIYLKLMIDGSPSQQFSARTLNINEPSSR
jgi:hypothetical protein